MLTIADVMFEALPGFSCESNSIDPCRGWHLFDMALRPFPIECFMLLKVAARFLFDSSFFFWTCKKKVFEKWGAYLATFIPPSVSSLCP